MVDLTAIEPLLHVIVDDQRYACIHAYMQAKHWLSIIRYVAAQLAPLPCLVSASCCLGIHLPIAKMLASCDRLQAVSNVKFPRSNGRSLWHKWNNERALRTAKLLWPDTDTYLQVCELSVVSVGTHSNIGGRAIIENVWQIFGHFHAEQTDVAWRCISAGLTLSTLQKHWLVPIEAHPPDSAGNSPLCFWSSYIRHRSWYAW